MIDIVSRDGWKAQPPVRRRPHLIVPEEQMGWVFHWYGPAVRAHGRDSEAKLLAKFQRSCMDASGDLQYSDLPHSFYIGQSGTIFEGRGWRWDQFANGRREIVPLDESGNKGWYSVCWLGGDNQQPSSAVIKNLTQLIHDSRVEFHVGLRVHPYSDWNTSGSPGARLEQLARTLNNWPIPLGGDVPERSAGAAANPGAPAPPRISPPPPLTPPEGVRVPSDRLSLVQADDGDHAVFVTDGVTKEWVHDRAELHRMCTEGKVCHAGRDSTGEFRPLLVPRDVLESIRTPGHLPLYPQGWSKPRTTR